MDTVPIAEDQMRLAFDNHMSESPEVLIGIPGKPGEYLRMSLDEANVFRLSMTHWMARYERTAEQRKLRHARMAIRAQKRAVDAIGESLPVVESGVHRAYQFLFGRKKIPA